MHDIYCVYQTLQGAMATAVAGRRIGRSGAHNLGKSPMVLHNILSSLTTLPVHPLCIPWMQGAMADAVAERRIGQPLGRTMAGKAVLVVGFGGIAKELLPR